MRRLALLCVLTIAAMACLAATPAHAQTSDRPNILFAIADDASYPHMGAYGTDWVRTPAFDRVAEQGILFTRAYTNNAKCAPSRSIVLTGRYSWQLEEAANHWPYFPTKFKVYTEALAQNGYFVGMTGKGWAPGIAKTEDGEPRHLAGQPFDEKQTNPPTGKISGKDYAANFKAFLNARPEDKPFCFWYGAHEPHRGYAYGSGIAKGGKELADISAVPEFWPDNEVVRTDMLDYAFELEYFDEHLGRMLDMLEERGELDNTLIVVTADNGMPFPRAKGQAFEMSNHMPLAIMWPSGIKNPGRVVNAYVSFIDFAPTFIEVAGLQWSQTGMHPTPGRSLTDIFSSEKAGIVNPQRDYVLIGKERHDVGRPQDRGYPIRGIIKDGMIYLHNFKTDRWPAGDPITGYLNTDGSPTKTVILDGRTDPDMHRFWEWCFGKRPAEQLYKLSRDPANIINLADDAAYQPIKRAMKSQLFDRLKAQNDPRMTDRGYIFDEYPYADKPDQNFYERFMSGELTPNDAGWVNPSDFEEQPLD